MAAKMTASGVIATFDLSELKAKAAALGIDWLKIWNDIEQYGPQLVGAALSIATDIASGNWAKVISDLFSMGPTVLVAVVAILNDLGIKIPVLTP